MAPKSRSQRTTRSPKRRPPKKRAPRPCRPQGSASAPPGRPRPAWSRRRLPRSRTRSARRSPEFWPSAICWRRPISTSASGAGSIPSRPAPNISPASRHCLSMPPEAASAAAGVRQDLFDLRALARSAGDSLAGRAAAKGLQSRVDISEKLPALVVGDPVRLRAALENLIDNAVKFTEQGGVALTVEPMRGAKGKVGVAFAVSDSGIGLTLAEIKRLFRPFSQANVSIASRFGGAGLGLSSVKAARARDGRRHRRCATARRRHHLHADGDVDPREGVESGQLGADCRYAGPIRHGRCAFSASRTIRSAASCSTPSSPNSAIRRNSSGAARPPPSGSRKATSTRC